MRRQPTLVDVAAVAGVSVATAARVLWGTENSIRAELAERVNRAAKEVGYVPNTMARSLRGGGPAVIGLVVGDMVDPYFAGINEAVTIEADARGLLALVGNMQRIPSREVALCKRLWEYRGSGIMLAGGGFDQMACEADLEEVVSGAIRAGVWSH